MTPVAAATLALPVRISTLILDLEHEDAAAETLDCHRLHARIAGLFDAIPCPDGARILWSQPRRDILVLQGPAPVSVRDLPPGYAVSATTRAVTVPPVGARVAVSLIANPTMRQALGGPDAAPGSRGPRIALPPQRRVEWLARKLDGAIRLDDGRTGGQDLPAGRGRRGRDAVTLARHCYRAEGAVADQENLARLVLAGVGSGKGYGCGLLVIQERTR
jgi:hypothetical protein